ncbi:AAA-like domain-containing protein [Coleofasciculus sp. F4-SAH-05]|uniref:AAA-like domain-containing protein n=1 Tax=Coleofasciculus sp. F4-SAH-05 TaxID=3069525 RepID=UPI0032FAD025
MRLEEALELLQSFVYTQTQQHLNTLQIAVLRGSWQHQSYEQIAETYCFSSAHAKTVGAKLWNVLSQVFGTKVNKKNFSVVLERKAKEWMVEKAIDIATQSAFPGTLSCQNHLSVTSATKNCPTFCVIPELPGGQVPLESSFYIERPPIEERCYDAIGQPGALIHIHAPTQMGKTSLMAKILQQGRWQEYHTVTLSFQLASSHVLSNLDKFLQWFCASIGKSLGLPNQVADYWDTMLGGKSSSTDYFENYLLAEIDNPIVIGLDNVEVIFQYPEIASNFFCLLRTWNEKAKYGNSLSRVWEKLRLVVVYSTEIYTPLMIHHSAFNLGLSIELPEFTREQVQDLAWRHELNWDIDQVKQLMSIVGGHPYLIRKGLYHILKQDFTLEELLVKSTGKVRIYSEYLCHKLSNLRHYPELYSAFTQVTNSPTPVELEWEQTLQLQTMGLVQLKGDRVLPSCNLYRQYFNVSASHLQEFYPK